MIKGSNVAMADRSKSRASKSFKADWLCDCKMPYHVRGEKRTSRSSKLSSIVGVLARMVSFFFKISSEHDDAVTTAWEASVIVCG